MPPQPLVTTDLFIICIVLPFPECDIVGVIQHVAFSDWPLLLSNMHVFSLLGYFFFFFFCFLGPHPQHMEVPRLEVQSELQLLAYSTAIATSNLSLVCDLHHSTTAQGNARSLTHWARPGIKPVSSRMLVRFISEEPWWQVLFLSFLSFFFNKRF